jgi:hypothetical protein
MKFPSIQRLLACAALAFTAHAHASSVTVDAGDAVVIGGVTYTLSGSATFAYSDTQIGAYTLGGITTTGIEGATYDSSTNTTTTAIASLTVDTSTGAISGVATTGGENDAASAGLLLTGGSLNVVNLTWDEATSTIYADVSDSSGNVASITQLALFTVTTVTGSTTVTGEGTFTSVLSGIYLTTEGLDYITEVLGLGSLAQSVIAATDFGTITASITATAVTTAVPEPSSQALLLLGLGGIGVAARRQHGNKTTA